MAIKSLFCASALHAIAFALIDRPGIVSQFNVVRTELIDNKTTPLQVGNGNFAFNVDNTGMQVWQCQAIVMTLLICGEVDISAVQYPVELGMA